MRARSQRLDLGEPRWSEASAMSGATFLSEGAPRLEAWAGADAAQSRHEATASWASAGQDLRSARQAPRCRLPGWPEALRPSCQDLV